MSQQATNPVPPPLPPRPQATVAAPATSSQVATAKKVVAQRSTTSYIPYIAIIVIGILTAIIGFLGTNIYANCPNQSTVQITYQASVFAAGFGIGILVFLILAQVFASAPNLSVILLAFLLAITASVNIYYLNTNQNADSLVLNLGLLGVGVGILLAFLITLIPNISILLQLQILGIFAAIAMITFAAFGINMYYNCGSPSAASGSFTADWIFIGIAILIIIIIGASFALG